MFNRQVADIQTGSRRIFTPVIRAVAPAPARAPAPAPAPAVAAPPPPPATLGTASRQYRVGETVNNAPVLDWATFKARLLDPYFRAGYLGENADRGAWSAALGLDVGGKAEVEISGFNPGEFLEAFPPDGAGGEYQYTIYTSSGGADGGDVRYIQSSYSPERLKAWREAQKLASYNRALSNPATVYTLYTDRITATGTSGGRTRTAVQYKREGAFLVAIGRRDYTTTSLTQEAIKGGILLAGAVAGLTALQGAAAGGAGASAASGSAAAGGAVSGSGLVAGTGTVGLQIPGAAAVAGSAASLGGTAGAGLTLSAAQVAAFAPTIGQTIAGVGALAGGLDAAISAGANAAPAVSTVAPVEAATIGSAATPGASAVIPAVSSAPAIGSIGEVVGAVRAGAGIVTGTIGAVQAVQNAIGSDTVTAPVVNGAATLPPVTVTGKRETPFPWWIVAAAVSAIIS